MFLDNRNPCFWKFHVMVPFDTFLVNCLFDPACVAVGILSSKTNQLMKEGGCWIKWLFQSRTLHLEERLLNFQFLPANNFCFHCWLLHHPYCCFLHTSTGGENLDLSICLDHTHAQFWLLKRICEPKLVNMHGLPFSWTMVTNCAPSREIWLIPLQKNC